MSGKPSKYLQLYTPLRILLVSVFRSIVLVKHEIFSFGVREFMMLLEASKMRQRNANFSYLQNTEQKTAEKPVSNGVVQ